MNFHNRQRELVGNYQSAFVPEKTNQIIALVPKPAVPLIRSLCRLLPASKQ